MPSGGSTFNLPATTVDALTPANHYTEVSNGTDNMAFPSPGTVTAGALIPVDVIFIANYPQSPPNVSTPITATKLQQVNLPGRTATKRRYGVR